MSRRTLGVNTHGFIWSTPAADAMRRLGASGYREFELVVNPPHLSLELPAGERREIAQLAARGLTVRSVNVPSLDTNLASPMQRMREYSVRVFRDAIELARDLGAQYLIVVPGRVNPLLAPEPELRERWMRESLEQLMPHAVSCGINLAIENVPFASFPDAASLGAFVRSLDSPAVSVCYDAANAHFIGESPAGGLRLLRDLVRVVHLSDTTRRAWRHDEVGLGDVPFAETAAALGEIGYAGPCMLEIIDTQPEAAIARSHGRLAELGFAPRGQEETK